MKFSTIGFSLLMTALLFVNFQTYAAPSGQEIQVDESDESQNLLYYEPHFEGLVKLIVATGPATALLESALEEGSIAVLSAVRSVR